VNLLSDVRSILKRNIPDNPMSRIIEINKMTEDFETDFMRSGVSRQIIYTETCDNYCKDSKKIKY